MEKNEIEKRVIAEINNCFEYLSNPADFNPDNITRDSLVKDVLNDSLDRIFVIMEIERLFGIKIPEEETENIETIGDLVDLVEKYVN